MIAIITLAVTGAVALFIIGGAIWFSWDSDRRIRSFARSEELVPGKPGRAPKEWATAASTEALLHRRIRYAIADVHENPAIGDNPELVSARDRLDDAVFAIDDTLIAADSLGGEERDELLERAEEAVTTLEELPKKLWEAPADQQRSDIDDATAALASV